jgi:hypothetical protein
MNILDLFKKRNKVRDKSDTLLNEEQLLNNAETFTIPDINQINKYIKAFNVLLSKGDLNNTFVVVKFIEQKSANGLIYVVKLKKSKSKYSKLLIKIQKSELADPASYEYYIGLALNILRGMGALNFGLVYGRFNCGFNPIGKSICDKNYQDKTYVLYEYITSLSDKTITLADYITSEKISKERKNSNLVNILIMLMISLQKAQDTMGFTHYDLHLGNVLLVQLNKTYNFVYEHNGKKYNIILDYFPFIIDYGRSYVNPDIVDKVAGGVIYDSDKKKSYKKFKDYQNKAWKNREFMVDVDKLKRYINRKLMNNIFVSKLSGVMEREFGIKRKDINVEMIMDKFYKDENGKLTSGITPYKSNLHFDHCKLLNIVCDEMLDLYINDKYWSTLSKELEITFPFVIPGYYSLPKYYKFTQYDLEKPIDVVEYLYMEIEDLNNEVSDKLSFSQLGGDVAEKIYKKMYKKMKECK